MLKPTKSGGRKNLHIHFHSLFHLLLLCMNEIIYLLMVSPSTQICTYYVPSCFKKSFGRKNTLQTNLCYLIYSHI